MVAAHTLWGCFPVYWRQIQNADSMELACHRVVWSFVSLVILLPILLARGWWGGFATAWKLLTTGKVWRVYSAAAVLIGINWAAFIWAVNNNQVLQASLGYYINPIFNVLLGVLVLGERLSQVQWTAVALATVGVAMMTIGSGGLPWISLAMASAFACYGLVKKGSDVPVLLGLFLEVAVLFLPAAIYVGTRYAGGISAMQTGTEFETALLLGAGLVTLAPLALFAAALQRVPLSLMGILQYIGPTLQFFVGAVLFGESIDQSRMLGFVFVWAGSLVFLFGPAWLSRKARLASD